MQTLINMRPSVGFESGAFTSLPQLERGRGARSNPSGRFETLREELVDDGWETLAEIPRLKTEIFY